VQAQANQSSLIGDFSGDLVAQIIGSTDTDGDGAADIVRFQTDGAVVEVDFRNATESELVSGKIVRLSDDDGSSVLITADDFMEFARFGGWAQLTSVGTTPPGGTVNFGAFGAPTPERDMPNGQFRYEGKSVGVVRDGGNTAATTSDVTMVVQSLPSPSPGSFTTVRFRSRNTQSEIVEGIITGTVNDSPDLDFDTGLQQPADGNSFSLRSVSSEMEVDGAFYGDAAQEAAGTFHGEIDGRSYGGAFGATR
jgi:flagellar hook-associated protein FlgK